MGSVVEVEFDEVEQSSPATVATKASVPAVSGATDLDFNFGDLGEIPGVVVGDIGIELSRLPVEKTKFTKDSRSLISIITNKVAAVKVHYREGLGSYLCFGGKCCELDGLARVKYLFPILVYNTDKKGSPVSRSLQYKVLAVGKDQYDDIKTIIDLNGDISNFDLLVTCKDEQYQKISFTMAGEARWKKNQKMIQETLDFWKENLKHLVMPVARKITEADLLKDAMSGEINSSQEVDFNDVFKD